MSEYLNLQDKECVIRFHKANRYGSYTSMCVTPNVEWCITNDNSDCGLWNLINPSIFYPLELPVTPNLEPNDISEACITPDCQFAVMGTKDFPKVIL